MIEAILFAAGEPLDPAELRRILRRYLAQAGPGGAALADEAAADGAEHDTEASAEADGRASGDGLEAAAAHSGNVAPTASASTRAEPAAAADGDADMDVAAAAADAADGGARRAPGPAAARARGPEGAPEAGRDGGDGAASASLAARGDDAQLAVDGGRGPVAADEAVREAAATEAAPKEVAAAAGGVAAANEDGAPHAAGAGATSSAELGGPEEAAWPQAAAPAAEAMQAAAAGAQQPEALVLQPPPGPRARSLRDQIEQALQMLRRRWAAAESAHGFTLVQIGEGYTFRTRPRFAAAVAAIRESRPARLSRPALESLAIVAYRQPVTKPELDQLRGVDSGGTLKLLLERQLVAIVGKKEEPGRPLLYGTTPTFLSLYNLASLAALPSLRQFNELNEDSEDALRAFDGLPSLSELAAGARTYRLDEAPSTEALDDAVGRLRDAEGSAREMLLAHGVALADADAAASAAPPAPMLH